MGFWLRIWKHSLSMPSEFFPLKRVFLAALKGYVRIKRDNVCEISLKSMGSQMIHEFFESQILWKTLFEGKLGNQKASWILALAEKGLNEDIRRTFLAMRNQNIRIGNWDCPWRPSRPEITWERNEWGCELVGNGFGGFLPCRRMYDFKTCLEFT